ncbi:MAG TPA: hypothetical protein PKZ99_08570, partial [Azospirillaceae bacterium]|nr:hypothetical protein [Azospirillaceae bacterium]
AWLGRLLQLFCRQAAGGDLRPRTKAQLIQQKRQTGKARSQRFGVNAVDVEFHGVFRPSSAGGGLV